ncbi:hypothetical protein QBC39DRAFT_330718 [Podospora conica]|nr:hypothetical protein QBC39DRAFT_330718 [Schizothecium conicum]
MGTRWPVKCLHVGAFLETIKGRCSKDRLEKAHAAPKESNSQARKKDNHVGNHGHYSTSGTSSGQLVLPSNLLSLPGNVVPGVVIKTNADAQKKQNRHLAKTSPQQSNITQATSYTQHHQQHSTYHHSTRQLNRVHIPTAATMIARILLVPMLAIGSLCQTMPQQHHTTEENPDPHSSKAKFDEFTRNQTLRIMLTTNEVAPRVLDQCLRYRHSRPLYLNPPSWAGKRHWCRYVELDQIIEKFHAETGDDLWPTVDDGICCDRMIYLGRKRGDNGEKLERPVGMLWLPKTGGHGEGEWEQWMAADYNSQEGDGWIPYISARDRAVAAKQEELSRPGEQSRDSNDTVNEANQTTCPTSTTEYEADHDDDMS